MIQFYFLSIFINVLVGYALVFENDRDALEIKPGFSLRDETVRLILGIISMIVGVLKLLSPVEGDVLILGDLVPAAVGFASGFILVYEYYKTRSTIARENEEKATLNVFLIRNKKILGYAAITAAVLHFLFPKVLLL